MKNSSAENIIGKVYGELTVLEELEPHVTPNGTRQRIVKCRCSCGNEFVTRWVSAKSGGRCFNCKRRALRYDITGKRFGKLTVISMADDYVSPSGVHLSRCYCKCDCGNTCIVNMSGLVTGGTQSCGCLKNSRGLLKEYPEYLSKYDFEKNIDVDIDSLTTASHLKVWWKCPDCGNSWYAVVSSQTNLKKKHGCPYCSGKEVIKGVTDLSTQRPDLLSEWDYTKNTIKPDEISSKSGLKAWWVCKECGYSWNAVISNRANGSGCPQCNKENVNSFSEQAVFYYAKQVFPDAINTDKHLGAELDIYIPSRNIAIEYDGDAWHRSAKKTEIDEKKNQICLDNDIELIRIREPKCGPMEHCTIFRREDSISNKSLDDVISRVISYLSPETSLDIDTLRDTPLILSQVASKKYNNSIAVCYPELAREWHPSKNGNLTPDKVNRGTNRKVWWLGKCGHEYQMAVCDRARQPFVAKNGRTHNPQGCPYCSGKRVLVGFNDLQSVYPEIAKDWHPVKNGTLAPDSICRGSNKKVWWLGNCGHEYQMTVNERAQRRRLDNYCPICNKKLKKRGEKNGID